MKKLNAGVWAGSIIALFSIVFLIQSLTYPYTGTLGLGPGFLPVWISGIMLVLSICYIFESIKGENANDDPFPKGEGLKKILFIIGSIILFLILLSFIGFVLSSIIFLFILLFRSYKWYTGLGISVAVSIFLFWLFGSVLSVPLPINGLGF